MAFFVLMLAVAPFNAKNSQAVIFFDGVDFRFDVMSQISNLYTQYSNEVIKSIQTKSWWKEIYENNMLPVLKKIAIQKVNNMTTEIVTKGNNGKPYLVTNWSDYLIKTPEKEASVYVNSLLDSSLRGRDSSANYTNSAYYAYLRKQALGSVNKSKLDIGISSANGDLKSNMFMNGNLKAFNEFLKNGNNPQSLSVIVENAYDKKIKENRLIAEKKQVNGYIPMMDANGNIKTPAAVIENAYNSASNMGREMIVNATKTSELAGAVINLVMQSAMKSLKDGLIDS